MRTQAFFLVTFFEKRMPWTLPPKKLLEVVFADVCDCSYRVKKSPLPNQKTPNQRASLDRIAEMFFRRLGGGPLPNQETPKQRASLDRTTDIFEIRNV